MKMYVCLILCINVIFSCEQRDQETSGKVDPSDTNRVPSKSGNEVKMYSYMDTNYHFSIDIPSSWHVYSTKNGKDMPIINIYDPLKVEKEDLPLNLHTDFTSSHISFYPRGLAVELPFGLYVKWKNAKDPLSMNIPFQKNSSYMYHLKNGDTWAYFIQPTGLPASWSEDGYIFSRLAVENFESVCYEEESKQMIAMNECDPYIGDSIVYKGKVDSIDISIMKRSLQSIVFFPANKGQTKDAIKVGHPEKGEIISSPLKIKGKARGNWYFEGDFPLELKDMSGNTLVKTYASAKGEWMTEDYVPFETTLTFDVADANNGYLILHNANASGLPEHDRSITIPVKFE